MIDPNGDASKGGKAVAEVLEPVCEDNGLFGACLSVAHVNEACYVLFPHDLVHCLKWHLFWEIVRQDHTAYGGLHELSI